MFSGWVLGGSLILLCLWLAGLIVLLGRLLRVEGRAWTGRKLITVGSLIACCVGVLSLFALHATWLSPEISQRLGVAAVSVLGLFIFWPTLAALVLSPFGFGRSRWIIFASSVVAALWDVTLILGAAISIGASQARHPIRYLIPAGYVGWVTVKYGERAPSLALVDGTFICRVPESGVLATSSIMEDGWASDKYFYYSDAAKLEPLLETNWGGGGKVWGGRVSVVGGEAQPSKKTSQEIYIGTEEQFRREEGHPFSDGTGQSH